MEKDSQKHLPVESPGWTWGPGQFPGSTMLAPHLHLHQLMFQQGHTLLFSHTGLLQLQLLLRELCLGGWGEPGEAGHK